MSLPIFLDEEIKIIKLRDSYMHSGELCISTYGYINDI